MEVKGVGGPQGPSLRRSKSGKQTTETFRIDQDDPAVSAASQKSGVQPVAAVDSLLSLQEVGDQGGGRKRAIQRASSMLDILDDLKIGLLEGNVSVTKLQSLMRYVETKRDHLDDPSLSHVLDEIELRARVEIAKFQST